MLLGARSFPSAALVALASLTLARGAEQIPWQTELAPAMQAAAQSNRLVLVHCWATWCGPCMRMEREVFTQPGLAGALSRDYVLVKLNADEHQAELERFGVRLLPSDVILAPDGRVLKVLQSPQTADQYAGIAAQIAAAVRASQAPRPVAAAAAPVAVSERPAAPPQVATVNPPIAQQSPPPAAAAVPQAPAPPTAAIVAPTAPSPPGPTAPAVTSPPGPAPAPPAVPPRLALDGYCPVQLMENRVWAAGDGRTSSVYEGQLFQFSSPEAQQWFWNNPPRYAPVAGGMDVVLALDHGQQIPGQRQHGVYFGERIYLFASEQSLSAFYANPQRYANSVLPASARPATAPESSTGSR